MQATLTEVNSEHLPRDCEELVCMYCDRDLPVGSTAALLTIAMLPDVDAEDGFWETVELVCLFCAAEAVAG